MGTELITLASANDLKRSVMATCVKVAQRKNIADETKFHSSLPETEATMRRTTSASLYKQPISLRQA